MDGLKEQLHFCHLNPNSNSNWETLGQVEVFKCNLTVDDLGQVDVRTFSSNM